MKISFVFNRSCVDENQLCKGIPLCRNKKDLQWCKNATSQPHSETDLEWKPYQDRVKCISPKGVCFHSVLPDGKT